LSESVDSASIAQRRNEPREIVLLHLQARRLFYRTGDRTLSTLKEQDHHIADGASHSEESPAAELLIAIWHRRRWLAIVTALGLLAAIGIALLTPNEYTSTALLMPPNPQAFTSPSVLSALNGNAYSSGLMEGELMSERTPGEMVSGVLSSRTVMDDIINRFDLRKVYHCKLDVDARKVLMQRTKFAEDLKSGIITLSVTDLEGYRARDITEAYIEELNKLNNSLSASAARRERMFLEQRLKSINNDLETSSRALSQFSSRNATLDFQKQGEATVEEAGHLQAELITAESELSALKAQYSDDNVRVRAARGRVFELQSQLKMISGASEGPNGANGSGLKTDQVLPSVRELPLLGFTYYNLSRQVATQEEIDATLTKQYELAKVQEAMEIPQIMVLDPPDIPERRTSPHRTMIVLVGAWLSFLAGIAWILATKLWARLDCSHPAKALATVLLKTIRSDRSAKAN
jgi:uncharacterized protein involved in exopolysaccharide biosynthesis